MTGEKPVRRISKGSELKLISALGKSGPKARPTGVVDGQPVDILRLGARARVEVSDTKRKINCRSPLVVVVG